MFDVDAWLKSQHSSGQPLHRRLCFLLYANGGAQVHGWGILSDDENGHQRGLEMNDALELIHMNAFIEGLCAAGIDVRRAFAPFYEVYVADVQGDERCVEVSDGTLV